MIYNENLMHTTFSVTDKFADSKQLQDFMLELIRQEGASFKPWSDVIQSEEELRAMLSCFLDRSGVSLKDELAPASGKVKAAASIQLLTRGTPRIAQMPVTDDFEKVASLWRQQRNAAATRWRKQRRDDGGGQVTVMLSAKAMGNLREIIQLQDISQAAAIERALATEASRVRFHAKKKGVKQVQEQGDHKNSDEEVVPRP